MNYAFALKILGWNKIYTTRNFIVDPITDGYGPILDSELGTKGVLATDYLQLLDPEHIKYEFALDPVTQEMESSPASFRLYGDEDMIAEVVQVKNVFAELNQNISAPTSEMGMGTFTVKSKGDSFPSGAQYVQIGQETWKITSRSGNIFNFSQRGCFGSIQEKSVIAPENPVYVTPIAVGQAGRGVELWLQEIGANGEVVSLKTVWKGFVEYARLSDRQYVEIICRDSFSYIKNNSVNIHMMIPTTARSYGFDRRVIWWQLAQDMHVDLDSETPRFQLSVTATPTAQDYFSLTNVSRRELMDTFVSIIGEHLKLEHGGVWLDPGSFYKSSGETTDGKVWFEFKTLDSISDWGNGSVFTYWMGTNKIVINPVPSRLYAGSADYHKIRVEHDKKKFATVQFLKESESDSDNRFYTVNNSYLDSMMDYIYSGPSGSMSTALKNNIAKTEAKIPDANKLYEDIDTLHVWMKLRGRWSGRMTLQPTPNNPVTIYGPVQMDSISYVAETRNDYIYETEEGLSWEYGTLVESKDYISGLFHGYWNLYGRFFSVNIINQCENVILPIETVSPMFRRFDIPSNNKTLGEELSDHMKFFDYYFVPDEEGRIQVRNFADDLSNSTPDILITSDDLLDKPEFAQDSALVNQVTIKSNGFQNTNNSDNFIDYASVKKHGGKKPKEIDITGTIFEFRYFENRDKFQNILSERYLRRFSGIRNIVTCKVPLTFYEANIGDCVQLTDWITPNQSGVIGGSGELYTLIKKEVNWSDAEVVLTLILFPFYKFEEGNIVPCARIESIDGPNVFLANEYIDTSATMTDYSASGRSGYRFTADDRGTGWFQTGYKILLTNRSDTNWYSEQFDVLSNDPTTFKVTLTSSPGSYWTNAIDNGEIVDIHYSVGDQVIELQFPFTYIGSPTTGFINTTQTNPNKKWRAS